VWVAVTNSERFLEFNQSSNTVADRLDGRNLDVRRYSMPVFFLVTALGFIGMRRLRRARAMQLLMVLTCYFAAANICTVFSPRLRAVFDLTCCIATGALIAQIRSDRIRSASVAGGLEAPESEGAASSAQPVPWFGDR